MDGCIVVESWKMKSRVPVKDGSFTDCMPFGQVFFFLVFQASTCSSLKWGYYLLQEVIVRIK